MHYSINREQVSSRILDGAAVIVNHQNGYYYSLNRTGTFLWELLSEQEMTLEELTGAMAQKYSRKREELVQDLKNLIEELTREDLLVVK